MTPVRTLPRSPPPRRGRRCANASRRAATITRFKSSRPPAAVVALFADAPLIPIAPRGLRLENPVRLLFCISHHSITPQNTKRNPKLIRRGSYADEILPAASEPMEPFGGLKLAWFRPL